MKPPANADLTPPKGKAISSKAGDSKKRTPPPPTSPEMCDDVNPHKKPRMDKPGTTLWTGPKGPNVLDKHLPSKTSLAEIFRNRVRDQHLQPLPPKAPVMPSTPPPPSFPQHKLETMKQRKHVRATNVMYMEQQEAFLRESIQRWTQVQQDMIKDVTSVVVL
ncbi:hypothetical protein DYB37_004821 [Aphanomyces astaci]|uniref:Uncharacterized protein n=1 Tax=Aphanomyces astaci TaxID=112090 RepID=A0A3R6YI13_APHAT|nr:hypothetical protein DYB37_004821 [Aphanomyces astaci]